MSIGHAPDQQPELESAGPRREKAHGRIGFHHFAFTAAQRFQIKMFLPSKFKLAFQYFGEHSRLGCGG